MINLSISNIIVVLIIFFIYGIYFLYEHSDFIDDMFYTETFVNHKEKDSDADNQDISGDENDFNEPSEKQFFNAVDENNKILHSFCKKLNVLDKPSQSNLIFNRFSKEFIEKKISI